MGAVNTAPERLPRGRPRSTASHQSVLQAVARLIEEEHLDFETLTIEGIAAEAGVGKQTIYRWWSSKASVLLEAIMSGHVRMHIGEVKNTGDLRADLQDWLHTLRDTLFVHESISLARSLVAASIVEEVNLADLLRHDGLEITAAPYRRLTTGVSAGELREDIDVSAAHGALVYPIILRLISGATPTVEWFDALVDVVLDGIGH